MTSGADFSYCQPNCDYGQLKSSGVQFAWHKLSDWSPKGFFLDSMRDKHINGLRAAGIWSGDYLFLHTTPSPIDQADFFLKHCDLNQLRPVVDAEILDNGKVPGNMGAITLACMQRIEQSCPVQPILYGSTSYLAEIVRQAPGLGKYMLWVAEYHVPPSPDHLPKLPAPLQQTQMAVYQWCGNGRLPGCPVPIDQDVLVVQDIQQVCC